MSIAVVCEVRLRKQLNSQKSQTAKCHGTKALN